MPTIVKNNNFKVNDNFIYNSRVYFINAHPARIYFLGPLNQNADVGGGQYRNGTWEKVAGWNMNYYDLL